MSLRCGIVGLPNVGKSTLFNAMTEAAVAAQNYPFCTVDPNVGVVPVRDSRLEVLAGLAGSARQVPATVEFVDIAGLIAGASRGEGLGNQFLAHIREADAIVEVVRCFAGDDIVHVEGSVDPVRDAETIQTELLLADLSTAERGLERARRHAKTGDKEARAQEACLEELCRGIDAGIPARLQPVSEQAREAVRELGLLTAKPILFLANVDEGQVVGEHSDLQSLREYAKAQGSAVVPVCVALEQELTQLDAPDRQELLGELDWSGTGTDRVIEAGYRLLGCRTYFTAGPKEACAWTIRHGWTAPQAAAVIHTDFQRGFICAEVIAYDDYVACAGEAGARTAGKCRNEGREYEVQEADVVHFRFNV